MNENMLRMALVINTSHDNFIKNLSNILLYLLYNDGSPNQYTADELKDLVEKTIHLQLKLANKCQAIFEKNWIVKKGNFNKHHSR